MPAPRQQSSLSSSSSSAKRRRKGKSPPSSGKEFGLEEQFAFAEWTRTPAVPGIHGVDVPRVEVQAEAPGRFGSSCKPDSHIGEAVEADCHKRQCNPLAIKQQMGPCAGREGTQSLVEEAVVEEAIGPDCQQASATGVCGEGCSTSQEGCSCRPPGALEASPGEAHSAQKPQWGQWFQISDDDDEEEEPAAACAGAEAIGGTDAQSEEPQHPSAAAEASTLATPSVAGAGAEEGTVLAASGSCSQPRPMPGVRVDVAPKAGLSSKGRGLHTVQQSRALGSGLLENHNSGWRARGRGHQRSAKGESSGEQQQQHAGGSDSSPAFTPVSPVVSGEGSPVARRPSHATVVTTPLTAWHEKGTSDVIPKWPMGPVDEAAADDDWLQQCSGEAGWCHGDVLPFHLPRPPEASCMGTDAGGQQLEQHDKSAWGEMQTTDSLHELASATLAASQDGSLVGPDLRRVLDQIRAIQKLDEEMRILA